MPHRSRNFGAVRSGEIAAKENERARKKALQGDAERTEKGVDLTSFSLPTFGRLLAMTDSFLIRQAVVDTVSRLCRAFDERDWVTLRSCLADTVATDYSRFRGTPPARLTAEEFLSLRRNGLAGLCTQHLCFNHLVTLEGERAHCRCDFIIHRWPERTDDTRFFHTYGYYHYSLVETARPNWLIESITQFATRSEGSPELHGAHRSTPDAALESLATPL